MDITTSSVLSGNTSQAYAIKNPMIYIYATTSPGDWYTGSETYQNDALWGDEDIKSSYDPCPTGWRVPTSGTWSDFARTADVSQPMNGTFPYYIKGTAKEDGTIEDYHQTNGRLYNATSGTSTPLSWYPGTGYRHSTNGALGNVGHRGYSWSVSVSNTNVKFMYFTMDGVSPSSSSYRAWALSVRCVQK
ncbi:MAG TPA: fibrobacter succinogenes major paralogous domain-containing protein [Candidatus Rikenella faecigallinarum]|uniref:Fibrobacter succinogenes major paralogous domain-containing protein n=1 Tax=Candidatus Rikenella faecigallinarum TaxID=2838745 RepID=A0A9D1TXP8_9BACT|nr:fibrobacter succinogenes major paralogous domain-containing protein [Candidatus Rikenella faecigallinarum]